MRGITREFWLLSGSLFQPEHYCAAIPYLFAESLYSGETSQQVGPTYFPELSKIVLEMEREEARYELPAAMDYQQ